ncbi:MAG: PAS domain-containing protein, partial [Proteobacteria bacterium]|nr:PAS domain-containing protein [Pseudomonadota bacterium]
FAHHSLLASKLGKKASTNLGAIQVAAYICGTPIALVTLVDQQRQWFKARYGLEASETPREVAFCAHAINQDDIFEVSDTQSDPRFTGDPLVRSYAGAPLVTDDGFAIGTLCVIGHEPRTLSPEQRDALKVLSDQVVMQLENRRAMPLMRKYESFLDHSPAAIVFKDRDGRFTHANRTFCDWMALPLREIIGNTSSQLHDEETAAAFGELDRQVALDGKLIKGENTLAYPDGNQRRVSSIKFPVFDSAGVLTEVASIHTDITKQHAAEEGLWRAQRMESIGHLTGGVAHDFNNLLTIVQGNLELLDTITDSPESQRRIVTALRALDHGRSLVRQLMSFARKQVLKPEATNIADTVNHVVELIKLTLRSDIMVETSIMFDLPPVFVDSAQLEAAILNLALNAQDAMPDGGTVEIFAVQNSDDPPFVRLGVRDTGTGIPHEIMDKVLEPFFTTKPVGKGSGLGLSMVFGFAKQSDGDLAIESELGRGTSISLTLPTAQAAEASETAAVPENPTAKRRPQQHVLLVEDNETLREMVEEMIVALGYRVDVAADAATAMDLLRGPSRYDVLFSDVMLAGGMSGADLADYVNEKWPDVRTILTSGYDRSAAPAGTDTPRHRYLPKPFRIKDLSEVLSEAY